MRERAVCFGPAPGLVGVLCEPDSGRNGMPDVLFWNVGLNHRTGPCRSWVEMGRALAALGCASLRFDLSGLGDSPPRPGASSDADRAVVDTRAAMDFLAALRGSQRFVLVANCSGVDSLHATSLADLRVVGAVAIDGYAYRNGAYRVRRLWQRLTQPSRWHRRFRLWRLARALDAPSAGARQPVWQRDWPSQERFASELAQLAARDVQLLFVFTSGLDPYYNYRGQFHDVFGYRQTVPVLFFPRADHLFSCASERQALTASVCRWVDAHFPRPTWTEA